MNRRILIRILTCTVHRVKNECGPQERQNYTDALDKLMTTAVDGEISEHKAIKLEMGNPSICERLFDTENAVGLKPTPRNVYARLKAIEQRIQFLETASPEYSHFVVRVEEMAFKYTLYLVITCFLFVLSRVGLPHQYTLAAIRPSRIVQSKRTLRQMWICSFRKCSRAPPRLRQQLSES